MTVHQTQRVVAHKCLSKILYLVLILEQQQLHRTRREAHSVSPEGLGTSHSVPLGVPFYLSCPIDSYHALYTWRHKNQTSPCLQMQSNCLHLIPVMTEDMYGKYTCVSQEKGYTNEVKSYHLTKHNPNTNTVKNLNALENDASALLSQLWVSLGCSMASAVMGMR